MKQLDEAQRSVKDYVQQMGWAAASKSKGFFKPETLIQPRNRAIWKNVKAGMAGRSGPEGKAFRLRASQYEKTMQSKEYLKALRAGKVRRVGAGVVASAAALGGALWLRKKIKNRAEHRKAALAKMHPEEKRLLRDKQRRRRWVAGGALGVGVGLGAMSGLATRNAMLKAGYTKEQARDLWKEVGAKSRWKIRAKYAGLGAVVGGIHGYQAANAVGHAKNIRHHLKNRNRYETVEDVINSLLTEEM